LGFIVKNKSFSLSENKRGLFPASDRALPVFPLSKRMLVDIAAVIDITLVVGSAFLIKYIYVQWYFDDFAGASAASGGWSYESVIALVSATLYVALWRRRHYSYTGFEDWDPARGFLRLVFTVIFSFGVALFVLFLLKTSAQFSRVWVFCWCMSAFLILYIGKVLWIRQFNRLTAQGYFQRHILLLGAGSALERAKEQLLSQHHQADVADVSDLGHAGCETQEEGKLSAVLSQIVTKGQSGAIDEVVIALPAGQNDLLNRLIRGLSLLPVDLKIVLDLGDCQFKTLDIDRIGSASVISVQKKPIAEWNGLLKAFEDYSIAILALIVFLPAMALIALAIKLDSRGPVLFRQRRHGSNHKIIEVWKFRTMIVMEDGDRVTQACKNDRRVTRVGRFLRKTSLDELPQLFNVLAGDMSLVGPRPHALTHNDHYSQLLENYASRHRVKPGITGWAQIHGFRGEITAPELMEQRVRYDLEYIDNWSIWFDLQILFLTPLFGFVSRKAY
jgi:putative colanic acid biosysnthesis UDP-glucose lipid carrier transferase